MKKTIIITIAVIVSLLVLGIIRDQVIKSVVTVAATQVVGAPVHIDGFSLGLFNQSVRISGFKIYNPKGFSRDRLLNIEKINVIYDLGDLLKKKLHLVNVEFNLKEMLLEKDKEGKLNVDSLKVAGQSEKKKPAEKLPMQIDILKLGIGKLVYKDYSVREGPSIQVYDINIHKGYKNITSAEQLAALILTEPMKQAGIQGAKIYGAAMLAGVAVLPVAIASKFIGKDSVEQDFSAQFDNVYAASSEALKRMGKITREDKAVGVINADINSVKVFLKLRKKPDNKINVVISSRKYLLPKPQIAAGVLYEIQKSFE